MSREVPRIPLDGSFPRYAPGVRVARPRPKPEARAHATVVVRPSRNLEDVIRETRLYARIGDFRATDYYAKYAKDLAAAAEDLDAVERYAHKCHLTPSKRRPRERTITLRGSLGEFERAFGVEFVQIEECLADLVTRSYRSHLGPLLLPPSLKGVVQDVIGLDRPHPFAPHLPAPRSLIDAGDPRARAADIARCYRFPAGLDGSGETIGIVLLGGGIPGADLDAYCRLNRMKPRSVTCVRVEGPGDRRASPKEVRDIADLLLKSPGETDQAELWHARWTLEAAVSLELLTAFAPCARLVVYLSTGTFHGQYAALSKAVFDRVNNPSIICCCWGADEDVIPSAICRSFDRLFQIAMLKGITICCSSGDDGGRNGAQFPASSPHVLACGGTFFEQGRSVRRETPWTNSGGGFSGVFDAPPWQKRDVHRYRRDEKTRGVPDVAARANMYGGYEVVVGDRVTCMGGTSVAVPLWAALVALINQKRGSRLGLFAPQLYTDARLRAALHEVTGESATYDAYNPGWNPCTGLGSPDGTALLSALLYPTPQRELAD
jgi:kumamolisin